MDEPTVRLTEEDKNGIRRVMAAAVGRNLTLLVHGEGENRCVSFYAEGTRAEARIAYPTARRSQARPA